MSLPLIECPGRAAALATSCRADIKEPTNVHFELRQNKALGAAFPPHNVGCRVANRSSSGDEFVNVFGSKYGSIDYTYGIGGASTDFVCPPTIV